MTHRMRLAPLCKALGLNKHRVEAWISKGMAPMSQDVVPGQARTLDARDGGVIAVVDQLLTLGVSGDTIKYLNLDKTLHLKAERSFLVIYIRETVDPNTGTVLGKAASSCILGESKIAGFLLGKAAVIVDLEAVHDRVSSVFEAQE